MARAEEVVEVPIPEELRSRLDRFIAGKQAETGEVWSDERAVNFLLDRYGSPANEEERS